MSQWLKSNYGSDKMKRTQDDREMEEAAGQSGAGGSLLGPINSVITPEQGKENPPVILLDACHDDRQEVRTLKRRRVEV